MIKNAQHVDLYRSKLFVTSYDLNSNKPFDTSSIFQIVCGSQKA